MKSIIESDELKQLVYEAIDHALIECAEQHTGHAAFYTGTAGETIEPTNQMLKFASDSPTKLKLTFLFTWDMTLEDGTPMRMICQPTIDLTNLGKEIK